MHDERVEMIREAIALECDAVDSILAPGLDDQRARSIATRLDGRVDQLIAKAVAQPNARSRAMYIDLLMGIALTAESLRSRSSGDEVSAERHTARAAHYLAKVSMCKIHFEPDDDQRDNSAQR